MKFAAFLLVGLLVTLAAHAAPATSTLSWTAPTTRLDGTPTVAAGDTMASHAGWVEVTAYDEAARQAWGQGAASGGVTTNATAVTFTASGTTTVGGGFLGTVATKGGSTGTLFSVKAATEGDRGLVASDTLDVTISLTVTSS